MSSDNIVHARPRRRTLYEWSGLSSKTLWDWVQLFGILLIPAVILLGLLWFSSEISQVEVSVSEAVSQQHSQTNLQIAKDQEQEAVVDTYLDSISALMLNNNLTQSKPTDEVREVARDRTLATLLRVDGIRKGVILQFLYQSGLIMKGNVIVNLSRANLSGAKLRGAELAGADLSGADLSGADLSGADLSATVLIQTDLRGATMPDGSVNP
jgi:fucose permease